MRGNSSAVTALKFYKDSPDASIRKPEASGSAFMIRLDADFAKSLCECFARRTVVEHRCSFDIEENLRIIVTVIPELFGK
jgi:hypothetical protein